MERKRDWVDDLFEFLSHIDPTPPPLPTIIESKLDQPAQFRDGEERIATITFRIGEAKE